MPKPRVRQDIPGVKVTSSDEDRRCAYVSPVFGRCRFWGAIHKGGAPAVCSGHFRHEFGAYAEQVVEVSLKWRPEYWDIKSGKLVHDDGSEVHPYVASRSTVRPERVPGEDWEEN